MSDTRFLHSHQTRALDRIERAIVLLSEASGFLRACNRKIEIDPVADEMPAGQRSPQEHASEIEDAKSQLLLIIEHVHKAPVGGIVS